MGMVIITSITSTHVYVENSIVSHGTLFQGEKRLHRMEGTLGQINRSKFIQGGIIDSETQLVMKMGDR